MSVLCCTKRSKATFVSTLGVRNGDKVYQVTPVGASLFVTCTCYLSPRKFPKFISTAAVCRRYLSGDSL